MATQTTSFKVEVVDGYRLGNLRVPISQIAIWLNFLVTPHYRAEIISAEQTTSYVDICFEANEGLYAYLQSRLSKYLEAAA